MPCEHSIGQLQSSRADCRFSGHSSCSSVTALTWQQQQLMSCNTRPTPSWDEEASEPPAAPPASLPVALSEFQTVLCRAVWSSVDARAVSSG